MTPDDLLAAWHSQRGLCAYTRWQLTFGYKSETTASLDRIDSSVGYAPNNIQWVHKSVNRMKSDFGEAEFISICQAVSAVCQSVEGNSAC
ncbi:hypothetical protein [Nocardia sp. NPDC004722]